MKSISIVLMDLDPRACPEDHCGRLARCLHRPQSTQEINVQVVSGVPPANFSPPPMLFLVRPAGTTNLAGMVQSLRSRWHPAAILGLFCTERDAPARVYQHLGDHLDDFLSCPFRDLDVIPRVQRFVEEGTQDVASPLEVCEAHAPCDLADFVGKSALFLRVLRQVPVVACSDATVLLYGETGTGKELLARAIHAQSPRHDKPFIPVNCGALPDHLVENELFGHVKGAYTDASSPEGGLIAEAEGGSLFLDEVDTLSAAAQVKLLRFLQDRAYRPLGCAKNRIADVRIIAATNAPLGQQVQAKRFREDLYYRLNVLTLHLPPLRERADDIPLLVTHFVSRYGHQYGRGVLHVSTAALDQLTSYTWPGNIRELETVIQRAVVLASACILKPEDFDLPGASGSLGSACDSFHQAKARVITQFERTYLSNLLATHAGNVTRAAQSAGKERRAFQRLLHKHGLQRYAFQG